MHSLFFTKKKFLLFATGFFFLSFHAEASYCPRCVKIESERAKEQTLNLPKSEYYDEAKKNSASASEKIVEEESSKAVGSVVESELAMEDSKKSIFIERNADQRSLESQRDPSYSTLFNIFDTKNFLSVFSGPFTLFIPTNNAFQHLENFTPKDFVTPDFDDRLSMITSYHVVSEQILNKSFKEGQEIKSIGGYNLKLKSDGKSLFVNEAKVLKIQAVGNQGIIYVIDQVLIPASLIN